MKKFNRLITYDYHDILINVEASLNAIQHTIMRHNQEQQGIIGCMRKGGPNPEVAEDHTTVKSTLKRVTQEK